MVWNTNSHISSAVSGLSAPAARTDIHRPFVIQYCHRSYDVVTMVAKWQWGDGATDAMMARPHSRAILCIYLSRIHLHLSHHLVKRTTTNEGN